MIPNIPNNFLGKSGFFWWVGVIENRADPLGLGRCQVRIFGYHGDFTDENSSARIDIPTEDLPWAMPMYPLNNSKSFSSPRLGEWVVGFFFDGDSAQFPVMMGVIPGYGTSNQFSATGVQTPSASSGPEIGGVTSTTPPPVAVNSDGSVSTSGA